MARELTQVERDALAGKGDGKPLRLEGRTISDLRIEAAAFEKAEWRDVELVGCELVGATFRGGTFEGLTLRECSLEGVAFEACAFTRWTLEDCQVRGARLHGCTIHRLRTSATRFEGLRLEETRVDGWEDERSELRGGALVGLRLGGARWKGTKITKARVERSVLDGGSLRDVSFIELDGEQVAFVALEIDGLSLAFGKVAGLVVDRVKGRGLALNELTASAVRLSGCELGGFTVGGGSKIQGLRMERSAVAALGVLHAQVTDLHVADAQLPGLLVSHSTIAGRSLWERVVLVGPDLGESTFEGLELRDVTVDGPLRAAGARFRGLKLAGLRRGPQFRLLDGGADYQQGDRFPEKP